MRISISISHTSSTSNSNGGPKMMRKSKEQYYEQPNKSVGGTSTVEAHPHHSAVGNEGSSLSTKVSASMLHVDGSNRIVVHFLANIITVTLFKIVFGMLMLVYSFNKCTVPVVMRRYNSSPDYGARLPSIINSVTQNFPWFTSSPHDWDCHATFMVMCSLGMVVSSNSISRLSSAGFGILTIFLLLTDMSKYNNHEYMFGSLSIIFSCLDCHRPEFSYSINEFDIYKTFMSPSTDEKKNNISLLRSITLLQILSFVAVVYLSMWNIVYGK